MTIKNIIEKPDLKIGFIPIICSTPLIYAHSHGIFEKNGLNVELTKPAGWSGVKELLVYDYIDAAHMLSPMPLACNLGIDGKKADIRLAMIQNINGQALTMSNRHIGIKDIKEMEGFTFGIPYRFSMHYYLLCFFLAANGLNPLKDVKMEEVSPALMPYYLKKGSIDGFFCADPYNQIPVHQKTGYIYVLSRDIWYGHPCCSFATTQDFINRNPNTYKIMLRSVMEAEYELHKASVEERKEIAQEISKPYYLDQKDCIPVAQSLSGEFPDGRGENFRIPDRIDFIPYPYREYGTWMLSQMQRWSQLPGKVNYTEIVDEVFQYEENREVAKSLGFKIAKKPSLGGLESFYEKDPEVYMLNQPFSAYKNKKDIIKGLDYLKTLTTNIENINKHMALVAGGNLDQQIEITDSGEIGQLQQIFNELTTNLRFMRDKLQATNESLEDRVKERTLDLSKANFELNKSREQLNSIFSSLKDTVFVISNEFEILYKNESAHKIFADVRVGEKCYEELKHVEIPCDPCPKNQLKEEGLCQVRFLQDFNTPGNGGVKTFDIVSTPLNSYDGKEAFIEVMRDVTRIKRNEEELIQKRHELEERIKELNCFFEFSNIIQQKELSWKEILTKTIEIIPPAFQFSGICCCRIIFKGQEFKTANFVKTNSKLICDVVSKDKKIGQIEVYYLEEQPEFDERAFLKEEQALIEALCERLGRVFERLDAEQTLLRINNDLEDIVKERTNDLNNSIEDLKRSNEELEQFAYVASHDLQEPLRMVASFTQLLQKRYQDKLDDDANEFIDFAVDGATRMQQLIEDLLQFSRVGTRGKPFKETDTNIVLKSVLDSLGPIINENNAVITYDPLPVIIADESQMFQLIQNLISNAVKFHGETPPKIHISGEVKESEWHFSVEDNGIGIDSKFFNKIFIIFQKLHKKEEYAGTGIGLAVSKKIVRRHGGRIWVKSQLGKGAKFNFTIPRTIQTLNSKNDKHGIKN